MSFAFGSVGFFVLFACGAFFAGFCTVLFIGCKGE